MRSITQPPGPRPVQANNSCRTSSPRFRVHPGVSGFVYSHNRIVDYGHIVPIGLTAMNGIIVWAIANRLFHSLLWPDWDADEGQSNLS